MASWRSRKGYAYVQLFMDVVMVTHCVHFSGGIRSHLAFLYLSPLLSGIFISIPAGVGAALLVHTFL